MKNKESFVLNLQKYITDIDDFFIRNKFGISGLEIDHICYKCSTKEEFEEIRGWFEYEKDLLYQAIISNRRIATVVFEKGLGSVFGNVHTLELSDQKPDNSQISGVDHVEIIWPGVDFEKFRNRVQDFGFELVLDSKPHHTTYNFCLPDGRKVKLSEHSLVDKVAEEMKSLRDK